MSDGGVHRWDEISLEKITEMVSRKVIVGGRQMMAQVYVKQGMQVPVHHHESDQMVYVLEGVIRWAVAGRELTLREGEVLHVPAGVRHQAEAVYDTFQLVVFTPPLH